MIRFFARGMNYLLGKILQKNGISVTSTLDYLHRQREIDRNYFDYIRLSSLELMSYEIKKRNLDGNVAELGVYKGKFAKHINKFFPERKLYLFDTFEGFDNRDVVNEKVQNYSGGDQDFSDTSVAFVLKQMPFPDKCVPVKGFFPESAKAIDEKFVLVSLDADLYAPIYEGLSFFYPRTVSGGFILIHDFNNDNYKGSRKAVEQFCSEQKINFVPIPDSGGSAIISK